MKLITMLFLVVLAALGWWEVVRMLGDRLDSCRRRQLTLMLPLQGDERDLENILHNLKNTQEYSCFRCQVYLLAEKPLTGECGQVLRRFLADCPMQLQVLSATQLPDLASGRVVRP